MKGDLNMGGWYECSGCGKAFAPKSGASVRRKMECACGGTIRYEFDEYPDDEYPDAEETGKEQDDCGDEEDE